MKKLALLSLGLIVPLLMAPNRRAHIAVTAVTVQGVEQQTGQAASSVEVVEDEETGQVTKLTLRGHMALPLVLGPEIVCQKLCVVELEFEYGGASYAITLDVNESWTSGKVTHFVFDGASTVRLDDKSPVKTVVE